MTNLSKNRSVLITHVMKSRAEGLLSEGGFFNFSGTEYKTYRSHFLSAKTAERSGYLSKSRWKRKGREPKLVKKPVLCAATTWTTFRPKDEEVILGYSLLNNYVVTSRKYLKDSGAMGCWPVFHHSETQPIQKIDSDNKSVIKKEKEGLGDVQKSKALKSSNSFQNSNKQVTERKLNFSRKHLSSNSNFSSPSLSSYDGETIAPEGLNACKNNTLKHSSSRARLITLQPKDELPVKNSRRGLKVYFPEGFDWQLYPELAPYRSSFLWFAHTLHERRFVNADNRVYGPDEFIIINSEFARNIDPNFRYAIKHLLDLDIIERDFYTIGTKSYGYRFADPQLRHATRRRIPLADKALAKRIDQHRKKQITTRTDRWLSSNLMKIGLSEIDEEFLQQVALSSASERGGHPKDKLDSYRYVLDRIVRREHLWTPDSQGRRYSLITNLKRELRSLLVVDGQKLQQIDIANSQLTFLALKMRREGVECSEFLSLCEQGQFYEHVAKHSSKTRSDVKKAITQRALFSKNDAHCQKSSIKKTFDQLFPEVARYLTMFKAAPDGNCKLAKELQFDEADLIVN